MQGVVCGHIHKAEIREIEGVLYCNDGDWVESLTALAESETGELRIVDWRDVAEEAGKVSSHAGRIALAAFDPVAL